MKTTVILAGVFALAAGGSIWLTVGTLAGSGRLRAHPCKNPNYSEYDGNWCQPGGRIGFVKYDS